MENKWNNLFDLKTEDIEKFILEFIHDGLLNIEELNDKLNNEFRFNIVVTKNDLLNLLNSTKRNTRADYFELYSDIVELRNASYTLLTNKIKFIDEERYALIVIEKISDLLHNFPLSLVSLEKGDLKEKSELVELLTNIEKDLINFNSDFYSVETRNFLNSLNDFHKKL